MESEEFIAVTEKGRFRVKINDDLISVGGKHLCVQIIYRNISDVELISLETNKGQCEMNNKKIYNDLTVHIAHLAFTILRKLHPTVHTVNLIDTSSFLCEGRPMGLMKSSLLLYGKTYYERKFNATPQDESNKIIIEKYRIKWATQPLVPDFKFDNKDLETILSPIYKTCNTWKEFMETIHAKFGKQICKYIYPWFIRAVGDDKITEFWKIDITDKSDIMYKKMGFVGGKRRTIKYSSVYRPAWNGNGIFDIRY